MSIAHNILQQCVCQVTLHLFSCVGCPSASCIVPPIVFSLHCSPTFVTCVQTCCSKRYSCLHVVSEMEHFWDFLLNLVFVRTRWFVRSKSVGTQCWLKEADSQTRLPLLPLQGPSLAGIPWQSRDMNLVVLGSSVTSGCFTWTLKALGFIPAWSRKNSVTAKKFQRVRKLFPALYSTEITALCTRTIF